MKYICRDCGRILTAIVKEEPCYSCGTPHDPQENICIENDFNTYIVEVKEVHISHRKIEAESPKEAIKRVIEGEGEEIGMDYSHTLDATKWQVKNEEGIICEPT